MTNLLRHQKFKLLFFSLILLSQAFPFFGENDFPIGSTKGKSSAKYFLTLEDKDVKIPSLYLNGYNQKATKSENGFLVEVKIEADSLRINKKWSFEKGIEKKLKLFDEKRANYLINILSNAQFLDEAIISVFKFVKKNWIYVEKNDNDLNVNEILNSKDASCLSFCKICKSYFDIMGIESEIVIGIKFPSDKDSFILKGGALHSWLKIKLDKENEIFCDPLFYFGFVTHNYIYLSTFENFKKENLKSYKNVEVNLISANDRIFYNPQSKVKPLFWSRTPFESSAFGIVLGKVLKEKDIPVNGKVVIKNSSGNLITDTFEGNFYFFIENDGIYSISIFLEGGREENLGDLAFSKNSAKKIVYYVKDKFSNNI